jgi:hypothetical protein
MILPDGWIPISLGYNCFVRVFLQEFVKATPRYPFDWTGTPMWSICELMDSDFEGMNRREWLTVRRRFPDSTEEYLTNTKYNMVFLHDYGKNPHVIPDDVYARVEDDYKRRIDRWRLAIHGKQPLLFFRVETPDRPRLVYEGSTRPKSEMESLCEFSMKLKTIGTEFRIIHITHSQPQGYDAERKIINLNYTPKDPKLVIQGRHIQAIIHANQTFIKECLADR